LKGRKGREAEIKKSKYSAAYLSFFLSKNQPAAGTAMYGLRFHLVLGAARLF
jgi:hypothetical protein